MQRLKDRLSHNTETLGLLRYRLPVVPHKAVAEVSKIGHYRRGELLSCMDGGVVAGGCSGHHTHNCWMWCGVVQS